MLYVLQENNNVHLTFTDRKGKRFLTTYTLCTYNI